MFFKEIQDSREMSFETSNEIHRQHSYMHCHLSNANQSHLLFQRIFVNEFVLKY